MGKQFTYRHIGQDLNTIDCWTTWGSRRKPRPTKAGTRRAPRGPAHRHRSEPERSDRARAPKRGPARGVRTGQAVRRGAQHSPRRSGHSHTRSQDRRGPVARGGPWPTRRRRGTCARCVKAGALVPISPGSTRSQRCVCELCITMVRSLRGRRRVRSDSAYPLPGAVRYQLPRFARCGAVTVRS